MPLLETDTTGHKRGANVQSPAISAIVPAWGLLLSLNCVAACQAAEVVPPRGGEGIAVRLSSGRTFHGQVDPRTDHSRLWLRNGLESSFILRPIDWDRLQSVALDGDCFSGDEFRSAVGAALAARSPDQLAEAGNSKALPSRSIVIGPAQSASPPLPSLPTAPPQANVRSLAIDARLANWDADVEPDGLVLDVAALNADGEAVAVHGLLEVRLMAERVGVVQRAEPFARLGRWSQPVRPEDFSAGIASYRLPFQTVDPEFDRRWASHGVVHARLSVPASGVFEQSADVVRIRAYSPVRDRFEQTTGRRYFAVERTGLGNR